jgi:hypothetical protein
MEKIMHTTPACITRTAIFAATVAFISLSATPARADLTGKQIIVRCRQAYASLQSYQGTTTIVTDDVKHPESETINYVRSSQPRIAGTAKKWLSCSADQLADHGGLQLVNLNTYPPYVYRAVDAEWQSGANTPATLLMDVAFTFELDRECTRETIEGSSVDHCQPLITRSQYAYITNRPLYGSEIAALEMQVAGSSTSTVLPSLLLGARYESPLCHIAVRRWHIEILNHRRVYSVETLDKYANMSSVRTLWIDMKTFLLVKMQERVTVTDLADAGAKQTRTLRRSTDVITETYTNVQLNKPISAATLVRVTQPIAAPQR